MIKLHYAELHFKGDIKLLELDETKEYLNEIEDCTNEYHDFIDTFCEKNRHNKNIVYLISAEEEIFITDNLYFISNVLYGEIEDANPITSKDTFLYEFGSYEEAYKCALDMKETNKLCYSK